MTGYRTHKQLVAREILEHIVAEAKFAAVERLYNDRSASFRIDETLLISLTIKGSARRWYRNHSLSTREQCEAAILAILEVYPMNFVDKFTIVIHAFKALRAVQS